MQDQQSGLYLSKMNIVRVTESNQNQPMLRFYCCFATKKPPTAIRAIDSQELQTPKNESLENEDWVQDSLRAIAVFYRSTPYKTTWALELCSTTE